MTKIPENEGEAGRGFPHRERRWGVLQKYRLLIYRSGQQHVHYTRKAQHFPFLIRTRFHYRKDTLRKVHPKLSTLALKVSESINIMSYHRHTGILKH